MTLVAADPDAVDKPLIQRVNGDHVPAFAEVGRDIDGVVAVSEVICGCGPLRDERTVDVEFVVVVGGDMEHGGFGENIRVKRTAEEDVAITVVVTGEVYFFKLTVEDIARSESGKFRVGDPRSGEGMSGHNVPRFCVRLTKFMDILYRMGMNLSMGRRRKCGERLYAYTRTCDFHFLHTFYNFYQTIGGGSPIDGGYKGRGSIFMDQFPFVIPRTYLCKLT